ncbi:MAG: hypothetical protein ACR2IF_12345 [Terriglobales bacterium]
MAEQTQVEVNGRMAEIRRLMHALADVRLVKGKAQRNKAQKLAEAIQYESALMRSAIRDLIGREKK